MNEERANSALEAGAYLHHLVLASPQPGGLADFYADTMEMEAEAVDRDNWILRGPRRRLHFTLGPARKLISAGFAVRDQSALAGLRERTRQADLKISEQTSIFLKPGAFSVTDPDGNVIAFGLAEEEPVNRTEGVIRGPLQHLTLATQDVQAIEDFFAGKLGFAVSDRILSDDGSVMTCFMRGNHEHHNLACFRQERRGIDHHSYEAGEWNTIRDWADHFSSRNIQLMWGPGRHGPGNNLFIFISDPDGNWIEISAELEVVQDRPAKHWPHIERTLNLWGRAIMRA